MVELSNEAELDRVFHALAHPTRRALLRRLERGTCSVTELSEGFDATLAAISKHVRVLEEARLVARTWRGTTAECRLEAGAMKRADAWIARYRSWWTESLDRLADAVEKPKSKRKEP
jgi:DNA-binding transcriptional ArsR family regulator